MTPPPARRRRPSVADDALLAGLTRLKVSDPTPPHLSSLTAAPASRPHPPRSRAAPALNVAYAYFPRTASPRYIDRSIYIPRADWLEVVERATGLGKSGDGDAAATDKLLRWIRAGNLDPAELFRGIVAGSAPVDARLNVRVLAVVARLCGGGGPVVLPMATYVTSARKPSPAVKVCLDVLKSLGFTNAPEEVLYDDNRVREMRLPGVQGGGMEAVPEVWGGKRLSKADAAMAWAVEAYAIAMGRKFIFHHRYPEVESNYSLDRHYRKMRVENQVDPVREGANMERQGLLISRVTVVEVALIAYCAVVAADRLERARAPQDIIVLAVAEACNVYAFAEYVRIKVAAPKAEDFDLDAALACLAGMVVELQGRGGTAARLLKRLVEPKVLASVTDRSVRPTRPESRHRREVLCTFSSFEAMHRALTPVTKSQGMDLGE